MPIPNIDFGRLTQEETLELAKLVIDELSADSIEDLILWMETENKI